MYTSAIGSSSRFFGQLGGDEGSHGPGINKRQDDFSLQCSRQSFLSDVRLAFRACSERFDGLLHPSGAATRHSDSLRQSSLVSKVSGVFAPFPYRLRYHLTRNSLGRNARIRLHLTDHDLISS